MEKSFWTVTAIPEMYGPPEDQDHIEGYYRLRGFQDQVMSLLLQRLAEKSLDQRTTPDYTFYLLTLEIVTEAVSWISEELGKSLDIEAPILSADKGFISVPVSVDTIVLLTVFGEVNEEDFDQVA